VEAVVEKKTGNSAFEDVVEKFEMAVVV